MKRGIYKFTKCLRLIISFLILLSACSPNEKSGFKTRISGSFPAFAGKMVTLSEIDIDKAIPLDTTKISNDGRFKFIFRRQAPGFYLIKIDNRNYLTLILDQEKDIELLATGAEIRKSYSVKGSMDSELYSQFERFLETNREKVDSLSRKYNDFQRSAGFQTMQLELDESYRAIFKEQQEYAANFIKNHCSSLASLLVINRRFGQRKILDEKQDYPYFVLLDSCLSLKYPGNKHLENFQKKVLQMKQLKRIEDISEAKLSPGNKSPDISLLNRKGEQVSLYSLKGGPVIITFWSSTDKDSRNANKQLLGMLDRHKIPGLKIYSIGLETYKEMWESAIAADGISNWINVTDFLGMRSSVKSLFNLPTGFPFFMLLDKDLTIIYRGKNVAELETKLGSITD